MTTTDSNTQWAQRKEERRMVSKNFGLDNLKGEMLQPREHSRKEKAKRKGEGPALNKREGLKNRSKTAHIPKPCQKLTGEGGVRMQEFWKSERAAAPGQAPSNLGKTRGKDGNRHPP